MQRNNRTGHEEKDKMNKLNTRKNNLCKLCCHSMRLEVPKRQNTWEDTCQRNKYITQPNKNFGVQTSKMQKTIAENKGQWDDKADLKPSFHTVL